MAYQLETASQAYGEDLYLAHNLTTDVFRGDRRLFGQRIPSFGVINFGYMNSGVTKTFRPQDNGITSDIMLKSLFAFTNSATSDEVLLKLFSGRTEIKVSRAKFKISTPDIAVSELELDFNPIIN